MKPATYLDHNATTPVLPAAAEAVARALALTGNASSVHGFGRDVRRIVEDARERIAGVVGAPASGVVFTSGGSEANALAIRGCRRMRVLVSAVEHDSVLKAVAGAEIVPVDGDGVIDLAALEAALTAKPAPALVSVMLANNETGVIQPLAAVAGMARRHGALVHCDAVQAVGRIAVDFATLGVDMLSLSAHKMGGPQGVGALVVVEDVELGAILPGGGQERGLRAGTENVPGIAGFGAAAGLAADGIEAASEIAALRDSMERRLRAWAPQLQIFGAGTGRLPNTSCLALPGLASETVVIGLDLAGVAISAGPACSSGKVETSHVLAAMGADAAAVASAIRVSLGRTSSAADIGRFIDAWCALQARRTPGDLAADLAGRLDNGTTGQQMKPTTLLAERNRTK